MCGFSGIFRWDSKPVDPGLLKKMTRTMIHRGPDDEGYYFSNISGSKTNVGLGFRRLSIIDLAGGHQPMSIENERYWIVFNGEIYNFPEIRKDLEKRGRKFLTRSDTEIILHLYALYGKECVKFLRGMFAFAIWDSQEKIIFIARDRIGKKPLFYAKIHEAFYFSSEMKALNEAEEISKKIQTESVPLYLTYQFIPSPMTIFEEIHRLPPAHTLVCHENGKIEVDQYWKVDQMPQYEKSVEEISDELMHHLKEATRIRLISDVPLGAFLSGGIDSSAVVGLMSDVTNEPVKTFSIGFEESGFSELKFARLVADHFNTEHREFIVKPEMTSLLPKLAWHYDQPFADPSALPSYCVARETKKFVTVALNGDGGDENFGGYLRYQADRIFALLRVIPRPLRSLAAKIFRKIPSGGDQTFFMRSFLRMGRILDSSPQEFNFRTFCYFDQTAQKEIFEEPFLKIIEPRNPYDYFYSLYGESDSDELIDQILTCDIHGYLPDCLLVKMDIASMANSLEARSPFLDHKLIEFAAKIPSKHKVKLMGGKWILKEALKNFLPDEILHRRKMGFGIPVDRWFRGPLKGFLRENLLSDRAKNRGYFKSKAIEKLIQEHQSAYRNHGYKLWALLMFELWHQVFIDKSHKFSS